VIIKPRNKERDITDDFSSFTFAGCVLNFVSQFRYLGHMLNDSLFDDDDDDICREIKCLVVRINVLISRFCRCSKNVKLVLFRSFCLCMYNVALWKYFSITTFDKFKAAYHKCIRKMFCYTRCDSMSGILIELPSVTIVHNSRVLFARQCSAGYRSIRLFNGFQILVYNSGPIFCSNHFIF